MEANLISQPLQSPDHTEAKSNKTKQQTISAYQTILNLNIHLKLKLSTHTHVTFHHF